MNSYSISCDGMVTPQSCKQNGNITVLGGKIKNFSIDKTTIIKMDSAIAYPALINVHDHLRGNYIPRVGPPKNTFYKNWSFWDADLKASAVYEERANLSVEQMYFLGAYKNLFSGVVTVNDHFPHDFNEPFIDKLPIRVIRNYTLAHECSSYDLKWGDGLEIEHKRAVEKNWPFITHLEEGFDAESRDGIGVVERAHCLDDHDLFIHCIGFSDEDIAKTQAAGASISWCPASNMFMFNVTCKIKKMMQAGINIAIGTDSTHTGSVNLLEEIRFARAIYQKLYGEDLSAKALTNMVTINAARAFRMEAETGSLEVGKRADLLLLSNRVEDPYENLVNAQMHDIKLLIQDGVPIYGEEKYRDYFDVETKNYGTVVVNGRKMFVRGNPEALYKSVRKSLGFAKKLDYLPFEVSKTTEGVL